MSEEESPIELEKVIQLVEGNIESFKDFIDQEDLSRDQLRKLLRAEQSAKNRESVVRYLKQELNLETEHTSNKESKIGVLKAVEYENGEHHLVLDIGGVQLELEHNPLLEFFGNKFEIAHPEDNTTHFPGLRNLDQGFNFNSQPPQNRQRSRPRIGSSSNRSSQNNGSRVSDGLENSSKGLKKRKNRVSKSEKSSPSPEEKREERLKKELQNKFGAKAEDLEGKSKDELEQMKKDLEEKIDLKQKLEDEYDVDSEELEGMDKDELEAMLDKFEKIRDKKKELLREYDVEDSEIEDKNFNELKDLEDRLEKAEDKREELAEKYNVDRSTLRGKDLSELNDVEEDLKKQKELAERLTEYGYSKEQLEGKDLEELHNLIDEIKQKERIIDKLDTDFDDEKLGKIGLNELKKLEKEKQEREDLIQRLKDLGFEDEKLRKCTNKDLRKLKDGVETSDIKEYEEILSGTVDEAKQDIKELEDPDYEKLLNLEENNKDRKTLKTYLEEQIKDRNENREEIKEEVQEDIEMLRGAVKEDKDQEKTKAGRNKIEDIENQFKNSWKNLKNKNEEEDDNKGRFNEEEVIQKLENYRDLGRNESAIKTAQIMKAYLEYQLKIRRELTYQELAENLENLDDTSPYIDVLDNFFRSMETEEYTGDIQVTNMSKVLDAAEDALREFR